MTATRRYFFVCILRVRPVHGRAMVGIPSGMPDALSAGSPTLSFARSPHLAMGSGFIYSRCTMANVKSPAHPEQSKQQPINLASLPLEEAIERARVAGREILADSDAISAVFLNLWTDWMNANVPQSCGQSEEEFGDLVNSMMNEFEVGMNEFIRAAANVRTLNRIEELILQASRKAWKVHNMLAFMADALPDDTQESLPVRCTTADLRFDMNELATDLMDLVWRARHE